MKTRPGLSEAGLGAGKKARLHRILFQHGLRNGTALFLPYDQGLEHGPRDFFANPAAGDPKYIIKLALEGGFNGIAIQIGLAEKFYWDYAGEVPLVLKLNGKTEIPPDDEALSPVHASVADAVRLGADAVGYTMYVGTPAAEADFAQFRQIREDAQRYGMPLVVWAYPRGSAVEAKGGRDSFYAVDYAARTASELGADVVKVNFPHPEKQSGVKEAYLEEFSGQQAIDAVVRSANRTLLLVSGGSKGGDEAMLEKARQSMEAGATGLIWGRNVWQRQHSESLQFVARLREILAKYPGDGGH
jgi:fructose-bisphosphate aldolase, class I